MVPIHFTTGTATPVWTQAGNFSSFYGFAATNAESAVYFLKLWWAGNTANSALPPVVGTTVPSITIAIETASSGFEFAARALVQNGPLFYTVTKNAADTDATALSTGGDVITLLVE